MIQPQDIHSLTDFARNTKSYARRLKKTGRPAVLTVNGRAEFVVQDASAYQRLLDAAAQVDQLLKLQRSLGDYEAGRVQDFESAITALQARQSAKTAPAARTKK